MFVVSMKTTRSHLWGTLTVVALLLVTMVAQSCLPAAATVAPVADVSTDEGRREYLSALGYDTVAKSHEVREVQFPVDPDDAWTAYNAIQLQAGMDLSPYRGRRVKCYTYTVSNYPGDGVVVANVYVYKDRVIGGDIADTRQDGFCHGLVRREDVQNGTTG